MGTKNGEILEIDKSGPMTLLVQVLCTCSNCISELGLGEARGHLGAKSKVLRVMQVQC